MHILFNLGECLDARRLEKSESLGVVCCDLCDTVTIIRQGESAISAKNRLASIRQQRRTVSKAGRAVEHEAASIEPTYLANFGFGIRFSQTLPQGCRIDLDQTTILNDKVQIP